MLCKIYLFALQCHLFHQSYLLLFSQRKFKFIHITSMKPPKFHTSTSLAPNKSLISSAVATITNHQQMNAMFPINKLMQHNYIIKTCMTTYTYLTTVIQNKRSAISTFETIVSVITTESLTNVLASDILGDLKPTKVRFNLVWEPREMNYSPEFQHLR